MAESSYERKRAYINLLYWISLLSYIVSFSGFLVRGYSCQIDPNSTFSIGNPNAGSIVLPPDISLVFWLVISLFILVFIITTLMWIHNLWELIPSKRGNITPTAAVWFLFIPLFNFYWAFRCFVGLANALNRELELQNIQFKIPKLLVISTVIVFLMGFGSEEYDKPFAALFVLSLITARYYYKASNLLLSEKAETLEIQNLLKNIY